MGSVAHGVADAFSDVDLIVAVAEPVPVPVPDDLIEDPFAGLELPGAVLYRRPKPRERARCGWLPCSVSRLGWPARPSRFVCVAVFHDGGTGWWPRAA